MDISQIGSSQWQSLLASLDPAAGQPGEADNSDPFANLLQSTQSAAAIAGAAANNGADSLAMLQELQNMNGAASNDPFLQMMNGGSGTTPTDPLLQMLDSANTGDGTDDTGSMFNSNFAVMDALQGADAFAGGNSGNALAMLQALNNSNTASLQAGL